MAIKNFIPTVWSEKLLEKLNHSYVGVLNCNRDYEGDIKEKGDTVKICGLSNILVSNYSKNSNMSTPQTLSDISTDLKIDQAKCFNFQIDDIDHAQSAPHLMDLAVKQAASALANVADCYVFGLAGEVNEQLDMGEPNVATIVEKIIEARTALMKKGLIDTEEIVLEVSPDVAEYIFKAKLATVGDNTQMLENGCIGSICGCKIYVSNNIHVSQVDDYTCTHKCMMRTKRAIAFAEQLSEIDAYRPELRFADAIKGLHLYGAKVVYQNEIVVLNFTLPMIYD